MLFKTLLSSASSTNETVFELLGLSGSMTSDFGSHKGFYVIASNDSSSTTETLELCCFTDGLEEELLKGVLTNTLLFVMLTASCMAC